MGPYSVQRSRAARLRHGGASTLALLHDTLGYSTAIFLVVLWSRCIDYDMRTRKGSYKNTGRGRYSTSLGKTTLTLCATRAAVCPVYMVVSVGSSADEMGSVNELVFCVGPVSRLLAPRPSLEKVPFRACKRFSCNSAAFFFEVDGKHCWRDETRNLGRT